MNTQEREMPSNYPDELSVRHLLGKLKSALLYFKSKWLTILFFLLVGGGIGFIISVVKAAKYVAVSTFVLDDENGKSGALGQYAGLASLAGIDISTNSGSIFQGDNILELYKSHLMIEKTLLTVAVFNGEKKLLIDRYVNFNNLRDKWKRKDGIDNINFEGDPLKFSRTQDSLINDITNDFNKKVLTVNKVDKKLSIIKVQVVTTDELFAKEFNIKLVENVNSFYVQTKTKKVYQNVVLLQRQADSVRSILNSSIGNVAEALDASPNANPSKLYLRVPSQKKQVDVQANTAIYGEIVKSLELSKISLRQEAPLIQVIDQPRLPLEEMKLGKLTGIGLGMLIGLFFSLFFLSVKKIFY